MAKNNRCGCGSRRDSNNGYGCLNSVNNRWRWESFPYYDGPCPDADGAYDCRDSGDDDRDGCRRRRRRGRCDFGLFSAMLPMAVTANGIIPLVNNSCVKANDFPVNSGLITVEERGTYLATYTVRVPEGAAMDSTITLNVNDASQSSAIAEVGGAAPATTTAQAIFEVNDRATVTLRSSESINITDTCAQPLFTLSLVKLD